MSNEWELLATAEDIEPGNTVTVETEDGDTIPMVFVKVRAKGQVELQDREGNVHLYSGSSLEEIGGSSYITGKSDEQIDIRVRG